MSDMMERQIRDLHVTLVDGDLRTIEVLTIEEVATLFQVNHTTVASWTKVNKIPRPAWFLTLGGHRRFFKVYILMLLEKSGVTDAAARESMIEAAKFAVAAHLKKANGRPNLAGAVLASR